MARTKDPAHELHVLQAAYLKGQYNLPQSDIGRLLGGFSQAHVSRLLKSAEQRGYLVTSVRFAADEVSAAALDETSGRRIIEMLRELGRARGTATPMVTHDPRVAEMADRVVTMDAGRIVVESRERERS